MRTVSFASPAVRDSMRDFVCHHTSTEGDPAAGQSIRHRPNEPAGGCIRGNGPQNVQTLFLTPEGRIFHVVSGYVPPDELASEMEFARRLFSGLSALDGDAARELVASSHRTRLAEMGFSDGPINARGVEGMLAGMMGGTGPGEPGNGFTSGQRSGNGLPRSGGLTMPENPMTAGFDGMIRNQILTDHRYLIDRPLESAADFDRDPTPLVGNGQSFFSSSSGGN